MSSCFDFPLDLQRDILEFSARVDVRIALQLVLVSSLVRSWIDPVLYEAVTLIHQPTASQFLVAIQLKQAGFFANVKALCIGYHLGAELASKVLAVCTRVEELACWVPTHKLSTRLDISPCRLSIRIADSHFELPFKPEPAPDFSTSLYSNVTHLEFMDDIQQWNGWDHFDRIPKLTHLSLSWTDEGNDPSTLVTRILASCPKLQILLLLLDKHEHESGLALFGSPRVVVMHDAGSFANWEARMADKPDRWDAAEAIAETQGRFA
ncbi:hypothetical protein HGRIS_008727 [Hohenbuehelia grisea]|uniref:F-box domain-containing protein n=1 Tax=Hohenbuehelia grisea TaxID=104357 RepID=A0ABR3J8W4_9AGAR